MMPRGFARVGEIISVWGASGTYAFSRRIVRVSLEHHPDWQSTWVAYHLDNGKVASRFAGMFYQVNT